ncbi:MAG: nuclear transport factor 2 family protein [Acidimicrobiales bacterium]
MDDPELLSLLDEAIASCEGFNQKNVSAWMDPFHADAVTYNGGFLAIAEVRPMAEVAIEAYSRFMIDNVDGRIVGDTAILFGDYALDMTDGTGTSGAFTFTCARVDGAWKTLLTHYTPTTG